MNDKESIERLKAIVDIFKFAENHGWFPAIKTEQIREDYIVLVHILNLLEKQKAEIEEKDKSLKLHKKLEYQYKNDYLNVIEDLKKKDKQIDLMSEEIAFNYDINSYADVITIKKQLKEKYERKAEEEK